jgi:hypothetical protein
VLDGAECIGGLPLTRGRWVISPRRTPWVHFRWTVFAADFSTRSGLLIASGPAAALSESLEHPEQIKIPPSSTIQLPSSAVVTFSLLRPQSEHPPFAVSCCVTRTMVPPSTPVNGGWWE